MSSGCVSYVFVHEEVLRDLHYSRFGIMDVSGSLPKNITQPGYVLVGHNPVQRCLQLNPSTKLLYLKVLQFSFHGF